MGEDNDAVFKWQNGGCSWDRLVMVLPNGTEIVIANSSSASLIQSMRDALNTGRMKMVVAVKSPTNRTRRQVYKVGGMSGMVKTTLSDMES